MATGLPDPKINFYGAEPSDTQAYQDALATSITALEQRYANPNWFNVAAGFFKPQLGGFGASLAVLHRRWVKTLRSNGRASCL